ncbi:MAG: hypothetical protein RIS43_51, partial [Actinomycetota bacterium]
MYANLIALCSAVLVLLWWWPRAGERPAALKTFEYWTDVRAIRFLETNATAAQTLTNARQSLRETSKRDQLADASLDNRVDALCALQAEAGLP